MGQHSNIGYQGVADEMPIAHIGIRKSRQPLQLTTGSGVLRFYTAFVPRGTEEEKGVL